MKTITALLPGHSRCFTGHHQQLMLLICQSALMLEERYQVLQLRGGFYLNFRHRIPSEEENASLKYIKM